MNITLKVPLLWASRKFQLLHSLSWLSCKYEMGLWRDHDVKTET